MSRQPSQPLQPWLWLGVPMVLCILATVLLAVPLKLWGLSLPEPVFAMAPAFAWAVIRPSVIGPFAVLAIGLFTDLYWGGPLGLWATSLLLAYFGVLAARSLMAGQSWRVLWGWYIAATAVAFGCAYLVTMIDVGEGASLTALGLQMAVTAALFPLAHRLIDRFEDADVRFR